VADEPTFRSGPVDSRARSASAKDRLATLFPDPDDPASRRHWYQRRGRLVVACLVVVALVTGTAVVAGAVGSTSPDYRTAVVGTHLVDLQLTGVATIEPISQATVAFPVSGTVSTVGVKTGDTVTVGQTLGSLDTAALTVTLHTQEAALAQAQLVLANALAGKTTPSGGASGGASSGVGASAATASDTTTTPVIRNATLPVTGNPTSGTSGTPDAAQISAAQQAVLVAQRNVDAAIAAADTALASAATICAAAGISTTSATHPTATTTPPATTAATGTTASPSTTPTPEQLQACQTGTKTVLSDQTAVSTAQTALATASSALDALLSQAASGSGTATTTTAPPATSGGGSTSRSGGTTGGTTSTGPSAADLVKYQAAVDAAGAKVAVAQQAIDQATIASPISGTVAAVNLKVGDPITGNSSTENVVIEGHGGYEVSTTVSVTNVPEVKVGQAATVVPDGSTHPLAGTVSSISVAPAAGASTTSYTVFVGLTDATADLLNGATGTVSIVTGRAASVLAVPTSAVTTDGTRHTVGVVSGGTTTTTTVQVGVVGDTWTEIKRGVRAGEIVALADLAEALPGSATTATTSSTATRGITIGNFAGAGRLPGGATP
jgi:multidrug efflux pump subunit AcrA (membrane-fusion protein)